MVRVCAVHGDWLLALADDFDLVWASSWGATANELLAPMLGLPELPYINFPPAPFPPAQKVPAVAAFVGERRAAWVDDQLTAEAFAWAASQEPGSTLLVPVDPAVGLNLQVTSHLRTFAVGPPVGGDRT